MKQFHIVTIICLIFTIILTGYFYPPETKHENLIIQTNQGQVTYQVEIADTPYLKSKGLMNRKSMPQNNGMLFIFEKPQMISMWMKNTYIPLDMLFLDKSGKIIWIYENAKPLDETIISSQFPSSFVIELNAGQVREKNIQPGNQVIFKKLDF